MNRKNFAHGCGVVIEVTQATRAWFDRDDLRRVIEFIRTGGLTRARHEAIVHLEEMNRQRPPIGIHRRTLMRRSATAVRTIQTVRRRGFWRTCCFRCSREFPRDFPTNFCDTRFWRWNQIVCYNSVIMATRQAKTVTSPRPAARVPPVALAKLSEARQERLDDLMARNNNGDLNGGEKRELTALVTEAEALTLANARALANHHRHEQERN